MADFSAPPYRLSAAATAVFITLAAPVGAAAQTQSDAEKEKTLAPVKVIDKLEREGNGYQGGVTRVGKLPQLAKDVPQALTIVSEALIEDKNADTLKEALRNVAGLTYNAGEGGRIGDNMNLRGFYSFGDLYLDGIRDVAQYNRETFNLEQVEVLRGSGSMLFGRGQAGGVINQVTKEPGLINKGSITGTVGTHDYKRVTTDVNQIIGENAAIRVNAMKTDAGSTRDHVTSEREGVNPVIRWGIGTADEFSLGYLYMKTNNVPDYGVPFFNQKPLDVSASRFYGTSSDYEDNTTRMTTGTYKHRFSSDTELRSVLRVASYTRDLWAVQPQLRAALNPVTGLCTTGTVTAVTGSTCINRSVKSRGGEEDTITSQTDFTTKFLTGSFKHEALVGLEILKEDASRWSYSTTGITVPATTVGDPWADPANLGSRYGHRDRSNIFSYRGESWGAYGQDTVEFLPGWKLLVGARHDWLNADYKGPTATSFGTSDKASINFSEWSYRSGLMFQPNDYHSYYLAWNDSFNPTADLYQLDFGAGYEAERSRTTELGAKWELFEGDLSLRVALYRAEKFNERNTDVESSGGLLSKKRHTDGFEIEAAGRLSNRWEVFGGLALMDAKIDEQMKGTYLGTFAEVSGGAYASGQSVNASQPVYSGRYNPNTVGMTPRNAPDYSFNLWTTYRLDYGWRVGLGLEGKGKRLAYGIGQCDSASRNATSGLWSYSACRTVTPNVAPAYVRWDALVAYEQPKYAVKLNLFNLADKRYYDSIYDNGGHAVPGSRRSAQLSVEYKF